MRHFLAAEIRAISPETRLQFHLLEFESIDKLEGLARIASLPPVVILEDRHGVLNGNSISALANTGDSGTRWLVICEHNALPDERAPKNMRIVSESDEPGEIRTALTWAIQAVRNAQIRWSEPKFAGGEGQPSRMSVRNSTQSLSQRQRQIMALIAKGCSNKQIAAELGIREGTVKAHLFSTYRCYGVNNRTQATLRYLTDIGENPT